MVEEQMGRLQVLVLALWILIVEYVNPGGSNFGVVGRDEEL